MSGFLGAILGEGGAALGGAAARAAAGEAASDVGATLGRAAGQDIARGMAQRRQRKKACQQAFPDNEEAWGRCVSNQDYL